MCGRTALTATPEELREAFGLSETPKVAPRWNVPPSQPVAVVRVLRSPLRTMDLMRWGLLPAWSKERAAGNKLFLARSETVGHAPAFRDALRNRRCLVVVDGFYEWKRAGSRASVARPQRSAGMSASEPFFVRRDDRAPFALAGVWDRWTSSDGEVVESCAILTQVARPPVDEVHERMPLVLERDEWDRWLDATITSVESLAGLLAPHSPSLVAFPVSPHVNDPRHDDPRCFAYEDPPQRSLFSRPG
jgi:putative SOS response-associated peptidase YedK